MRPIDADALKNMRFSCAMHDDNFIVYVPMREVKENIDKAPTIGGWISVKDRLPEKDGDYLTRLRHGGMKVMGFTQNLRKVDDYYFRKKKPGWYEYDSERGFCERNDITHYMPLPELPKEEIECNTD